MKRAWMLAITFWWVAQSAAVNADDKIRFPLKVSENHRFLVDADNKPFFYQGDTAWELFHRCSREDAELYLKDRAAKRFNVIQAVVLAEYGGLSEPNPYGNLPLKDNDPTKPVEAYFEHVDWIVNKADELGMMIGMLPTWGDKWNKKWGQGPEIFNAANAGVYGEYLGKRYKDKPIIWILGGDRPVENDAQFEILRALAAGINRGDEGKHLMTFHPSGQQHSSKWFQKDDWLNFNMCQSGHARNSENFTHVATDYALKPIKPCLDGEPGYEDHPNAFKQNNGYLDETDVRKSLYWSLFSGACGYTYGCHDIWQFLQDGRKPITFARTPWRDALKLPGSEQVHYARLLLESRPYLTRIPDQSLIASEVGKGGEHVQATRDEAGSFSMIYLPLGKPVTIDLGKLSGEKIRAAWFDPRKGMATAIDTFAREGKKEFTPPSSGATNDWILLLDDVAKGYDLPCDCD